MSGRELANAVLARLKVGVDPKVTIYDASIPPTPNKPALPYLVFYPHTMPLGRDRLAATASIGTLRFQITSCGLLREVAQAVAEQAQAALLDWRPAVAGWAPSTVQQDDSFSAPINRDDDVSPPVFFAVDQYLLTAVPA